MWKEKLFKINKIDILKDLTVLEELYKIIFAAYKRLIQMTWNHLNYHKDIFKHFLIIIIINYNTFLFLKKTEIIFFTTKYDE